MLDFIHHALYIFKKWNVSFKCKLRVRLKATFKVNVRFWYRSQMSTFEQEKNVVNVFNINNKVVIVYQSVYTISAYQLNRVSLAYYDLYLGIIKQYDIMLRHIGILQ